MEDTLNVTLTPKQMETLEFLTNNKREVDRREFLLAFPDFLPIELKDLAMYCKRIKFCLR